MRFLRRLLDILIDLFHPIIQEQGRKRFTKQQLSYYSRRVRSFQEDIEAQRKETQRNVGKPIGLWVVHNYPGPYYIVYCDGLAVHYEFSFLEFTLERTRLNLERRGIKALIHEIPLDSTIPWHGDDVEAVFLGSSK